MNKISRPLFVIGVLATLFSLPVMGSAFAFSQNTAWVPFVIGALIGAAGVFGIALGIFLKLAALLFRA